MVLLKLVSLYFQIEDGLVLRSDFVFGIAGAHVVVSFMQKGGCRRQESGLLFRNVLHEQTSISLHIHIFHSFLRFFVFLERVQNKEKKG